jgi:hypothetical protein
MDVKILNVEYGDVVVLTYDEDIDIDAANAHYTAVKDLLHETYGCVVVANREDLLRNITIIKNDGEVLPFR